MICDSLLFIGESAIADLMRVPFNFIDKHELEKHFQNAGFETVSVEKKRITFKIPGGIDQAIKAAYATPIGPKLLSLTDEKQQQFQQCIRERLTNLSSDGTTIGQLASNILEANK